MDNTQEANVNVNENTETITEPTVDTTEPTNIKTFTQDEVNELISKRLQKERVKLEQKIKAEADEAARLAKLSEEERQKALYEKEFNSFKEEKAKFERDKLLLETNKQLIEKNLPVDFANYLISTDAESTLSNINKFEEKWKQALNNAVSKK